MLTTLLDKYTIETFKKISSKEKIEQFILKVESAGTKLIAPYLINDNQSRKNLVCECPRCNSVFHYCMAKYREKKEYLCSKCTLESFSAIRNQKRNEENLKFILNKMESLGIKILDKKIGNASKVIWSCECSYGHKFSTSPKNLKRNINACPRCNYDSSEEYLYRMVVEVVTGKIFEKIRPDWLKSPLSGKNLELDIFNEELGIAFEYNGPHHYDPIYGEEVLNKVRINDKICHDLCKKKGIKLYSVKYLSKNTMAPINFIKLVQVDLREKGFIVTDDMCSQALIRSKHGDRTRNLKMIEKVKEKLTLFNREYISGTYENGKSILKIRCKCCYNESNMTGYCINSYVKNKYRCNVCITKEKRLENKKYV